MSELQKKEYIKTGFYSAVNWIWLHLKWLVWSQYLSMPFKFVKLNARFIWDKYICFRKSSYNFCHSNDHVDRTGDFVYVSASCFIINQERCPSSRPTLNNSGSSYVADKLPREMSRVAFNFNLYYLNTIMFKGFSLF